MTPFVHEDEAGATAAHTSGRTATAQTDAQAAKRPGRPRSALFGHAASRARQADSWLFLTGAGKEPAHSRLHRYFLQA